MAAPNDGRVVLELVIIPGLERLAHLRAAGAEGSEHLNGGVEAIGRGGALDSEELEARFVDGAGSEDSGLGNLRRVAGVLDVVAAGGKVEAADAEVPDVRPAERV